MQILTTIFFMGALFTMLYFFIMLWVLMIKSFKLFWKDRYDLKYEEIWGDKVLLFSPLLFPLKKMTKIVNNNEDLKSNKKITTFLIQIKKLRVSFIVGLCLIVLMCVFISIRKAMGATWVG